MIEAAIVHPKLARANFEKAIRPLLTNPEKYEKVGIKLLAFSYPNLDVELDWYRQGVKLSLRIDGTDYDYRPVSGWWIDTDGTPLVPGQQRVPGGYGFHAQADHSRQRCWFCFQGWREYHDHSSHQDVAWAHIRRDPRFSVLALIQQLHTDLNLPGVQRL